MMVISGGSYNGNHWSAMYDPSDQYADMVTDKYYAIMGICDGKEGEPAQEKPKNALLLFDVKTEELVYAEELDQQEWNSDLEMNAYWARTVGNLQDKLDTLSLKVPESTEDKSFANRRLPNLDGIKDECMKLPEMEME